MADQKTLDAARLRLQQLKVTPTTIAQNSPAGTPAAAPGTPAPAPSANPRIEAARKRLQELKAASSAPAAPTAAPVRPPATSPVADFARDVVKSTGIPSFLSSLYNLGSASVETVKGNFGQAQAELDKTRNVPFLGDVAPAQTGSGSGTENLKKLFGTGLEIGSTVAGGGAAKTGLQTGFKGLIKQGIKTTAREGAAAAFGQGTGEALTQDKSIPEALKEGAIQAPFGAGIGLVAPLAAAGTKKLFRPLTKGIERVLSPLEKKAEMDIAEGINKGIKPYFSSTAKPGVRERYMKDASEAVKVINEYKPTLVNEDTGLSEVRNPHTRKEMLDALDQAKGMIFEEYDKIARQAGEAGAQFDATPVLGRLDSISKDMSFNPTIREYAAKMIPEIGELHGRPPKVVQERIKDLNQQLQAFFLGRVDKVKAQVDASVAALMREQLDTQIENVGGEGYQALKNKYKALKTIEKDVGRQVALEARKNTKGLLDFTDIFTGSDLISGLASMNPTLIAKGLAGKGIKEFMKYLNDPNRYIKKMFDTVEKLPARPKAGGFFRPPVAGLLPEPPIITPPPAKIAPPPVMSGSLPQDQIKLRDPKLFAADRKLLPQSDTVFVPPRTTPGDESAIMQPAGSGVYEYNDKGQLQTVYDKSFRMNQPASLKETKQAAGLYKPPAAYFGTKAEREAAQTVPYPANVVEGKIVTTPEKAVAPPFAPFNPATNMDQELEKKAIQSATVGKGNFEVGEVYKQKVAGDKYRPVQIVRKNADGSVDGWYLGTPFKEEAQFSIAPDSVIPGKWTKPASELEVYTDLTDTKLQKFVKTVFGGEKKTKAKPNPKSTKKVLGRPKK